ncbi:M15 family metallopeptidase [Acuticoccus sp. MNP-M23]|nr:M15 family metallopeptidase [Acuticoccus sp. MNP-M23]WMS45158.1 M15 family metallopeptidase [Acuticoccus sp. MNP-M23]
MTSVTVTPGGASASKAPVNLGNIDGLDSGFEAALRSMAEAAKEAGHSIKVNSGFRSVERQKQLFDAAVRKYGSEEAARKWVAPPGRSRHNLGVAADLGFGDDAARKWAHDNAGQFGLRFPMNHEPWHVEPNANGGRPALPPMAADRREIVAKRSKEAAEAARDQLALAKEQEAARQRQADAIAAVNTQLAEQLEMAGLEREMLETGKFTRDEVTAAINQEALVREKLNQLETAGVTVTAEMEAAIRSKAAALFEVQRAPQSAIAAEEVLLARSAEMKSAFVGVGQPIVDTVTSIADGSAKAGDAVKGLIRQLANMAIQGALFGGGPLGGLFGGGLAGALFPGRASGGPVKAGQGYTVGEHGPERFFPGVNGRIANAAQMGRAMPSGGGQNGGRVNVSVGVTIDDDGGLRGYVKKVAQSESRQITSQGIRRYDSQMQGAPLLRRMQGAQERFG